MEVIVLMPQVISPQTHAILSVETILVPVTAVQPALTQRQSTLQCQRERITLSRQH